MKKLHMVLLGLLLTNGLAHQPVPEKPEIYRPEARLFVLDNRQEHSRLLAFDLPEGKPVADLSLPPQGMSLVATTSERYLLVSRGRDTDRQWLSVIWSGKEKDRWSRPVIAKSLLVGRGWNIGHGAHAYTLGGQLLAFAEREGFALRFNEESLSPEAPFVAERIGLPSPDHYHVVEAPEGTYLTLLAKGQVILFDRSMQQEKARFGCPVEHGEAFDRATGRSFFACAKDVLVTENGRELTRLAYPVRERIGAFIKGQGVFFGYSDGVQHLQRLDPRGPTLEAIALGGTLIRASSDGEKLYILLSDGRLQVREASRGDLMKEIRVSRPFPEMDESTGGAIYPDIAPWPEKGLVLVSLPHQGLVSVVDVGRGWVRQYIRTGGKPTRMVLVSG